MKMKVNIVPTRFDLRLERKKVFIMNVNEKKNGNIQRADKKLELSCK